MVVVSVRVFWDSLKRNCDIVFSFTLSFCFTIHTYSHFAGFFIINCICILTSSSLDFLCDKISIAWSHCV